LAPLEVLHYDECGDEGDGDRHCNQSQTASGNTSSPD
jgi:hypothetical protein